MAGILLWLIGQGDFSGGEILKTVVILGMIMWARSQKL